MWLWRFLQKVDKKSESWFQIVAGLASGSRLLRRWVGGRWRGREAPVATPPAPGQQMVATIHLPPSIPCPHLTPGSTAFTWATWTAWITSVTWTTWAWRKKRSSLSAPSPSNALTWWPHLRTQNIDHLCLTFFFFVLFHVILLLITGLTTSLLYFISLT